MLNEGDMLFIPALWFHKVIACGDENISLNWVFTKKKTTVISKTLIREVERYALQDYLSTHPVKLIRKIFEFIVAKLPAFVRWKWHYPNMIETSLPDRKFGLIRLIYNEIAVLRNVFIHADKIGPYMHNLKFVRKFENKTMR